MKDSTDRTKELSDLENIGPPSFLAEANLDNSLTYVEEITDYPPCVSETLTPRQRRNQLKDRYIHDRLVFPDSAFLFHFILFRFDNEVHTRTCISTIYTCTFHSCRCLGKCCTNVEFGIFVLNRVYSVYCSYM